MSVLKKRLFVVPAIVLCLGFWLFGAGSANAKEKVYEWNLFMAYGPEDGACCELWPKLLKEVERETDGRFKVNVFWSGQHPYEGADMLKVIKEGQADLAHFYGSYVSSVVPAFGIDGVPMLLPPDPMDSFKVMSGLWGNFKQDRSGVLEKELQDKWSASMVHMIPASHQRIFSKGYEVTGLESLKGHKIRTYSPELANLVEILGGTPVSMNFGEVYTGLAQGMVDGLITSTQFAKAGGFFDFCDTINMIEIMAAMDGLMVNQQSLKELPEDIRGTFLDVMHNSATKPETLELANNAIILEQLLLTGDVKAFVPEQEKRQEVVKVVKKEIWEDWLENAGELGQAAMKQMEEMKKSLKK